MGSFQYQLRSRLPCYDLVPIAPVRSRRIASLAALRAATLSASHFRGDDRGKPSFEMLPIRSDDPDFIDHLLTSNREFRKLMENHRKEADEGKFSALESIRESLGR
jgi:hypothetical protein